MVVRADFRHAAPAAHLRDWDDVHPREPAQAGPQVKKYLARASAPWSESAALMPDTSRVLLPCIGWAVIVLAAAVSIGGQRRQRLRSGGVVIL